MNTIDFNKISKNDFEEMISIAITNDEKDNLISIYNSLSNQINNNKDGQYLIFLIAIFFNNIKKANYKIDLSLNFKLDELLDEFSFDFSPERKEDSGSWESTSDYIWRDQKNNKEGSFLQLLLARIGVTVKDINDEKSNNQYIENIAATYLWFSMYKFIIEKINNEGYDNEDLAILIWTVIEDPISDEIRDILYGEVYGFSSFYNIVAPSMLGFNMDHYNSDFEENNEMEAYGDHVHDFKAIALDILKIGNLNMMFENENATNKLETEEIIQIKLSGRIYNYNFGAIKESYLNECKNLISSESNNFNSIDDLLTALITPNEFKDNLATFKSQIDLETLENECPNLQSLIELINEKNPSTDVIYKTIFNLSNHNLNIIENDALITINVDGKTVIESQKFESFIGSKEYVDYDKDAESKLITQSFVNANKVIFDINDNEEYLEDIVSTYKSSNGVKTISEWIQHQDLKDVKSVANNIQICQDNVVELKYSFKAKQFNINKLILLGYANMNDFHESAEAYGYSYLIYDSCLIDPKKKILGIKMRSILFDPQHGNLKFLIDG